MHQISLAFFLLVWFCSATAVSTSSLAKIKVASADLDALLSQPVSGSKADHDAVLKKINDLVATIEKSGDTKAALKYKGLVETKKQAIELSEKNVKLKAELVQTGTQVAVQEKQLAKASKKLESVGMSLPKAKTTVSDLIDEIDSFMNDFTTNANESNLDLFEQKITTIIQKALKKAETQDVKKQIERLHASAISIIYERSLGFFEDGLKGINALCIDQHENLESSLDPFLTDFHSVVFGTNLEYETLVGLVQDSTDQVKTMYQLFKVYCMQNGFSKKTLLQLDETDKNAFGHIFDEFIKSYEKILLLWLDAIETINAEINNLKNDPELELATWERMRSNSEDFVTYFSALVLFEDEVLAIIPNEFKGSVSTDLNAVYLLDLWDSFAHKKIGKSGVSSSIPKPPSSMPKQPLFVSEKPEVQDISHDQQLADAIAKRAKQSPKDIVIPPSSKPVRSIGPLDLDELKSKASIAAAKGESVAELMDNQLLVRLKTFDKLEKRIANLAKFDDTAATQIAYLKTQFDLIYDQKNAFYSPHGTMSQYYEDLPEIDTIAQKLDKKMIDSKKAGQSLVWTDEQKNKFNQRRDDLKKKLEEKKKLVYEYGYNLAVEATKALANFLPAVKDTTLFLVDQIEKKVAVESIKLDSLQKALSYFYFIVRFGIYKPIQGIPQDSVKKGILDNWCKEVIAPLQEILTALSSYKNLALDYQQEQHATLFTQFGQRVIAPLTAVIEIIFALTKNQLPQNLSGLQKQLLDVSKELTDQKLIDFNDYQGTIEHYDDYIIQLPTKKKNK